MHSVGPFDRFDGQHRAVLHAHALADVEPAHFFRQSPTELDIALLTRREWLAGQYTRGRQQFRRKIGGGHHLHTAIIERLCERPSSVSSLRSALPETKW